MTAFSFKTYLYWGIALFGMVTLGVAYMLFAHLSGDQLTYTKLLQKAQPTNAGNAKPYTAQQQRRNVQKDLFFTQKEQRLQLRLVSADALLVLEHGGEGTELIEKMQDVRCWMQEELFYVLPDGREALLKGGQLVTRKGDATGLLPSSTGVKAMQHMRYLEALSAIYHYRTGQVEANKVNVFRYTLPGHTLSYALQGREPTLRGGASRVEFSMAGKDLQFKADNFKASLQAGSL